MQPNTLYTINKEKPMKSLQITALALLLSNPAVHTGCDGYEDTKYGRALEPYIISIVAGTVATGIGIKKIYNAANTLYSESSETAPLINSTQTLEKAYRDIKDGLLGIGMGATLTITGFAVMVIGESNARENCCGALSNSSCSWK